MSRLPAMTYREVVGRLRAAGFVFDRQAKGSHEIWYNPKPAGARQCHTIPGTLPIGTLRAIIRAAGLTVDEFLRLK